MRLKSVQKDGPGVNVTACQMMRVESSSLLACMHFSAKNKSTEAEKLFSNSSHTSKVTFKHVTKEKSRLLRILELMHRRLVVINRHQENSRIKWGVALLLK